MRNKNKRNKKFYLFCSKAVSGITIAQVILAQVLFAGVLFFPASRASAATTIFEDSFGSTNGNTVTGWTEAESNDAYARINASNSTLASSPTPGHARLRKGASITKTISTAGFDNIKLKYYWRGDSHAESSDKLDVYWKKTSDSTFTLLNSHSGNVESWSSQVVVDLSSANNTSIDIKFAGNSNHDEEDLRIDDVSLTGDPIQENTQPLCSDTSARRMLVTTLNW